MAEDPNVSSFGEKLDAIGTHLTGLHSKLDAIQGSHEEHGQRLDALAKRMDKLERDPAAGDDEAEEKERQDAREREDAKRRADGESDADREARHAREDAAWQDGAAERRDARRMAADAVHRVVRADARHQTDADKHKFVAAQTFADSAYQAVLSQQAPFAQYGENLRDFRERLLVPLKRYSKIYKDAALGSIADETAFSVMEAQIFEDAIKASRDVSVIGVGQLRKEVTRKPTGHTETRFYGDAAVTWAPFSGGGVQFVRFNQELARASQIAAAARGR